VSFWLSNLSFSKWYYTVALSGVRKLARAMTKLSKPKDEHRRLWWEPVFELWWGFTIKYFVPFALWFLIMYQVRADTTKPYGGFHSTWQWLGFLFPLIGFLVFFVSIFVCTKPDHFDHDVDAAFEEELADIRTHPELEVDLQNSQPVSQVPSESPPPRCTGDCMG